ncbi:MAG: hypothetical protein JXA16_08655 [Bacteroidales bacterium]|nr:hypothetical protein [Bacteroidales bacterium]
MNKINEILNKLGIFEVNSGASTGQEWLNTTGSETFSVSPIDGNKIAKIKNANI